MSTYQRDDLNLKGIGLGFNLFFYEHLMNQPWKPNCSNSKTPSTAPSLRAFANLPVGLFRTDLWGQCIEVNERWCQITGYSESLALGHGWQIILHPEDRDRVLRAWENATQERQDYQLEFRCQTPDVRTIWVYGQATLETNAHGEAIGYIGTLTDMSQSQRSVSERFQERQLRRELGLLENILETVLAGYWDWDLAKQQEYLSPRFKQMFGYEDHELPNHPDTWKKLIFPEDLQSVLDCFERHVQSRGKIPYYNEVRYRHKDGSTVWVICSGKVIKWDRQGNPQRMIGCHIDISDRKQVELSLHAKTQELERFFSVADLLCVANTDGYFIRLNLQWEKVLGYPLTELEGTPFLDYIHPEDREDTLSAVAKQSDGKDIIGFVNRYRCQDGSYRWLEWRSAPSGSLIYAAARDITERQHAIERIRRYAAQLEASNRELEAFAYSVSHDLRAPLRAIDGFSQALLEDYSELFDELATDYFDRIRKNVTRMSNLIDDLLSLSRVSRTELQYTSVNLSQLSQEVMQSLQATEPERQVEVVIMPELIVSADPTLMRVILLNLLENAWKFTRHRPAARIEVGVLGQDERMTYFVRDDGAGFDMNYADKLFGVFQRLHDANDFAGIGIGLAIVQRAIHRHGGKIWAESKVDKGAIFYFTLCL